MKTLRRLALAAVAVAALAPTASAQLVLKGLAPTEAAIPGGPPKLSPPAYTADRLEKVLKDGFDDVVATGKGDARGFSMSKLQYKTKGGEKVAWSVSVDLVKRGDGARVVRVFFPCQAVPADPNPAKLQRLLEASGTFTKSGAYFLIGGAGKERMLYLVADVTTDELDAGRMQREVEGLLAAADDAMPLWGSKLTDPPAKDGKEK